MSLSDLHRGMPAHLAFYMDAGYPNSGLPVPQQALYCLSQLHNPELLLVSHTQLFIGLLESPKENPGLIEQVFSSFLIGRRFHFSVFQGLRL